MAGYYNPQQQQQFNYGNQMPMMPSTSLPQQMSSMMNQNQAFPTPQQMQAYQQQQQQQQQQAQQFNMMYQQMSASQPQQNYNVGQQYQQQTNYPQSSAVSMPNMCNTGYGSGNYATSGYSQQMTNIQGMQAPTMASQQPANITPYQMQGGQQSSGVEGRIDPPAAPKPVPPPPPIAPPTTTSKPPPPPTGPTDSTQVSHGSPLNTHLKPEVLKALKENSSYQKMESERAEVLDKQQQFETQYDKWESDFQQWLSTNRNHPDQTQLTKYTAEHESYRLKLQAIREELTQSLAHVELRQKQLSEKVSRDVNTSNRYHQTVSPTKPPPVPNQSTAAIAQPVRYNAPAAVPVPTQEKSDNSPFSGISQMIENERKMAAQSQPQMSPIISSISGQNVQNVPVQRFAPGNTTYSTAGSNQSYYDNMQPKSAAPPNQFTQSYSSASISSSQSSNQSIYSGSVSTTGRGRGVAPPPPIRFHASTNSSDTIGAGPPNFGRGAQRFGAPQAHPQRFSQDQSSQPQNDFNEYDYSEENYSDSAADQIDMNFDSYSQINPVSTPMQPPRPPAIRSRNPLAKNSMTQGAPVVAMTPRMPAVRPAIRKAGPGSGTGANTIPLAAKAPWQQRGGDGGVIRAPVSIDCENLTPSLDNISTSFSDDVNFNNLNFSKQPFDQTSKSQTSTQSSAHVATKPNVAISSSSDNFTAEESDVNKTASYKVVRTTPNAMGRGGRGTFANRGSRGGANQNSFNLKAPPFLAQNQHSDQTPGHNESRNVISVPGDSNIEPKTKTLQPGVDAELADNLEGVDEGRARVPPGNPKAGQQQGSGADLDLDVIKAALKSLVPADDEEDDDIERHFKASEIRNPQQTPKIRPQNPPWNPQRGMPTRVVAVRSRGGLVRGIPPQPPFVGGVPQGGSLHAVGGPRGVMQMRAPLQMRGRGVMRGVPVPFGRGGGRGLPLVEPTGMMAGQNGNMMTSVGAHTGVVQSIMDSNVMGGVNGGSTLGGGGSGGREVFCDMERYETEMEYRAWYDKFGKMYYKLHGPDVDPEKEQELQWEKEFFDRDHGPDPRHPYYPKWVSKHFGDEKDGKAVATSLAIDLNTPTLNDLITVPDPTELTDLIEFPGRRIRAGKIVLILRGPPGSGKSFLARLIKEREVILGDHQNPPRILSIDDYYLTEEFINKENAEEQRNAKITLPSAPRNKIVQYEYDEKMETAYNLCMFKCFKKSLEHNLFSFVVVDNINHLVSDFEQYLACAKLCGYKAYVVELKVPASLCFKRNTHKRSRKDVERIITTWEDPPDDCRCLEYNNFLEEHAEPETVKEVAKSVGVEPKLHKRPLSPLASSVGHRHRPDNKSTRTTDHSPPPLPVSSSGRVVTLDTILIDSRSPSPEQVVTDVAREESPLSFRPKHWSPRSGSRRADRQTQQTVSTATSRSRGSSPGKRSLFPIKAISPSDSKRSKYRREDPPPPVSTGAAITLSPPSSLRMVERQRTPSIERLLGKAIATVESLRSPKRDQKRPVSPLRRDRDRDRTRKHGDSSDVSKNQVEVVSLDSPERMSSSRRRSRSRSPHKRSSGSSRTYRRSKSRTPDRHSSGQSRRK